MRVVTVPQALTLRPKQRNRSQLYKFRYGMRQLIYNACGLCNKRSPPYALGDLPGA
ncbi:hypothetical protein JHK86_056342 [Glycine max]|nr:hypothetical protein JHK86_056342 [Glycine max]